ncbi:hypothetical protein AVEN_239678-1 [Araneus ventricosus]|uniref:RNase H type-1 domain-containing protein n=1 Tax=Araneus ventricosus TaxID=182803 RepID=A0A4Y2CTF9_ARAVE|nr:hypothetical protein AVEN_239678-1 [Araneus ventricosus]
MDLMHVTSHTLTRDLPAVAIDGTSDEALSNGGSEVHFNLPDGGIQQRKIGACKVALNFTCELRTIVEALELYLSLPDSNKAKRLVIFCDSRIALEAVQRGGTWLTEKIHSSFAKLHSLGKACVLQCISDHAGINGNEMADQLAKDSRLLNIDSPYHLALFDKNVVVKSKLRKPSIKKSFQICEINEDRNITKKITTRLKTSHFKGMRINVNGVRTYMQCNHCLDIELSPNHIFDCPAILWQDV